MPDLPAPPVTPPAPRPKPGYFAVDFDQTPFTVAWEITRACALACVHCRAEAMPRRDPRELTTEEGFRLIDSLVDYVGTGLTTDRGCLIVATRDHRDALEERLRGAGLDLSTAQATGQYVAVDAGDILSRIEVGDGADSQRFEIPAVLAVVLRRKLCPELWRC